MSSQKEEFLKIVFEHQNLVHKICRIYRDSPEDRKDLFQEIVYQLWKSYPDFKGDAKITSWMYRIGLNTALAAFRKPSITYLRSSEELEATGREPENTQEREEKTLYEERLTAGIKKLEEPDRAILSLYLEGMSYAEIAEITGLSENNVGVRLHRIKNKLKTIINP